MNYTKEQIEILPSKGWLEPGGEITINCLKADWMIMYNELTALKDDLKCCGNCTYRISQNMGEDHSEWCELREAHYPSSGVCPRWKYDGLKQKSRDNA